MANGNAMHWHNTFACSVYIAFFYNVASAVTNSQAHISHEVYFHFLRSMHKGANLCIQLKIKITQTHILQTVHVQIFIFIHKPFLLCFPTFMSLYIANANKFCLHWNTKDTFDFIFFEAKMLQDISA